ncbi:hypothetical protein KIPB_011471, partial [Kipferlia bialata]
IEIARVMQGIVLSARRGVPVHVLFGRLPVLQAVNMSQGRGVANGQQGSTPVPPVKQSSPLQSTQAVEIPTTDSTPPPPAPLNGRAKTEEREQPQVEREGEGEKKESPRESEGETKSPKGAESFKGAESAQEEEVPSPRETKGVEGERERGYCSEMEQAKKRERLRRERERQMIQAEREREWERERVTQMLVQCPSIPRDMIAACMRYYTF